MQCFKSIFLLVAVACNSPHAFSTVTLLEQQISNYINTNKEEQVLLLEKLVNINSGTMNIGGIEKVGKKLVSFYMYLRPEMSAMEHLK